MSMTKNPNNTDLEIENETKANHSCPKCDGNMVRRIKSRRNIYTHKKCLDCGFGYIKG